MYVLCVRYITGSSYVGCVLDTCVVVGMLNVCCCRWVRHVCCCMCFRRMLDMSVVGVLDLCVRHMC